MCRKSREARTVLQEVGRVANSRLLESGPGALAKLLLIMWRYPNWLRTLIVIQIYVSSNLTRHPNLLVFEDCSS